MLKTQRFLSKNVYFQFIVRRSRLIQKSYFIDYDKVKKRRNMNSDNLTFIYDGKCPFCNHFAELLDIKSQIKNISIIDGRKNKELLREMFKKGFDLDKGAILITKERILHGSEAIYFISNKIKNPSDKILKLLSLTFKSKKRSDFFFPMLVRARRIALIARGVPTSLQ